MSEIEDQIQQALAAGFDADTVADAARRSGFSDEAINASMTTLAARQLEERMQELERAPRGSEPTAEEVPADVYAEALQSEHGRVFYRARCAGLLKPTRTR